MKFLYCFLFLSVFAFVVNGADIVAEDTTDIFTTTPHPSLIVPPDFDLDLSDNISGAILDAGDDLANNNHAQKKKQQDIAKAVKATDSKPKNRRAKVATVDAKDMMCSVVTGKLVCYSVNQDDVVFDAAECVVAPNADKGYTICTRSLI